MVERVLGKDEVISSILIMGSILRRRALEPLTELSTRAGNKQTQQHQERAMAKEQFQRTKPHVNVGTIGHIDHGKSTLTAALVHTQAAKGLATPISYADITKGGTVRDETKTVTIAVSHVEYQSDKRHYAHIDFPGNIDLVKNMISGVAHIDGVIIVVYYF